MANAAIYLPVEDVDLGEVFPGAKSDRSPFRKPNYFEVVLNGETVRFNVMPREQIAEHLEGLRRYILSVPGPEERKELAAHHSRQTRTVLGFVAESEFEENPTIWDALFQIARKFEGFVFAYNSILLANRVPVIGPLREDHPESAPQSEAGPSDDDDDELTPPTAERVARRALVMSAVVCRGYLEPDADKEPAEAFRQSVVEWIEELGLSGELEEHERELLYAPLGSANPQSAVNATWSSEGLAVLAWALDRYDLPAYDVAVTPLEVAESLGFKNPEASRELLSEPELIPAEQIEALQQSIFTVHWRLRQYGLAPARMDLAAFADNAWFGPLSLDGVRLIDGDLAIGEVSIHDASAEERAHCQSITMERHRAVNWLLGDYEIYSEVDTST